MKNITKKISIPHKGSHYFFKAQTKEKNFSTGSKNICLSQTDAYAYSKKATKNEKHKVYEHYERYEEHVTPYHKAKYDNEEDYYEYDNSGQEEEEYYDDNYEDVMITVRIISKIAMKTTITIINYRIKINHILYGIYC